MCSWMMIIFYFLACFYSPLYQLICAEKEGRKKRGLVLAAQIALITQPSPTTCFEANAMQAEWESVQQQSLKHATHGSEATGGMSECRSTPTPSSTQSHAHIYFQPLSAFLWSLLSSDFFLFASPLKCIPDHLLIFL